MNARKWLVLLLWAAGCLYAQQSGMALDSTQLDLDAFARVAARIGAEPDGLEEHCFRKDLFLVDDARWCLEWTGAVAGAAQPVPAPGPWAGEPLFLPQGRLYALYSLRFGPWDDDVLLAQRLGRVLHSYYWQEVAPGDLRGAARDPADLPPGGLATYGRSLVSVTWAYRGLTGPSSPRPRNGFEHGLLVAWDLLGLGLSTGLAASLAQRHSPLYALGSGVAYHAAWNTVLGGVLALQAADLRSVLDVGYKVPLAYDE